MDSFLLISSTCVSDWGRIVCISSQMGFISQPGKVPYSATKAGLIGFTKVNNAYCVFDIFKRFFFFFFFFLPDAVQRRGEFATFCRYNAKKIIIKMKKKLLSFKKKNSCWTRRAWYFFKLNKSGCYHLTVWITKLAVIIRLCGSPTHCCYQTVWITKLAVIIRLCWWPTGRFYRTVWITKLAVIIRLCGWPTGRCYQTVWITKLTVIIRLCGWPTHCCYQTVWVTNWPLLSDCVDHQTGRYRQTV